MRKARTPSRRAVLAAAALSMLALGVGLAGAAAGNLDLKFDGDGWVAIDSGGDEAAYAIAVQPDGKTSRWTLHLSALVLSC